MEDPQAFARPHIVAADVPFLVSATLGRPAWSVRRTDDNRVPGDHRWRMEPDVPRDQIHRLIVFALQIDDAVIPEIRNRPACLRIQRNQLIAGRDVDDALRLAIGPVRDPPT